MSKRKTGTYEWAQSTVNCVDGCSHNCRYCYARANAWRFRLPGYNDWTTMKVRERELTKRRGKKKGVVMFPSQHDITPEVLQPCLTVLENLVEAGNQVLVVSKPHRECIEAICKRIAPCPLEFRFTIGCLSDAVREFWEPGAPSIATRLDCLGYAARLGYATSVSAEPLLEPWDAEALYQATAPHVTNEIWFGMLNRPRRRIAITDPHVAAMVSKIEEWQTDEKVMSVVRALDGMPHVKWKDSYQRVIDRQNGGRRTVTR